MRKESYRASSLAALGLQNLPLLSILGNMSLEEVEVEKASLDFSRAWACSSSMVKAELRRVVRVHNNLTVFLWMVQGYLRKGEESGKEG